MSKVRYIYRRAKRKIPCNNSPAHAKQSAAFFEFGGEHSFFSAKHPELETGKELKHQIGSEKEVSPEGESLNATDCASENQVNNIFEGTQAGKSTLGFESEKYSTAKEDGKGLLAHELNHVTQQNSAEVKKEPQANIVKKEHESAKKDKEGD